MKIRLLALLLLSTPMIFISNASAQYAQYGAVTAPARQMLIDKKILYPKNNQFVDNLNIDQHTFLPNQEVIFRVTVTNVIQSDIKNLQVTDKLPKELNFVSTSFGNYDANTHSINFKIDLLKVGESKTFEIKTKIKEEAQLPANVSCQSNLARVTAANMVEEDTASFCISKQVLPTSVEIPKTGPIQTTSVFILSSLSLAISYLMRRITILERR